MNIIYPAICHYEDGGYWCEFPDLPGCFSQGKTDTEIVENAKEALECHTESILEEGGSLPKASTITKFHVKCQDFVTYISCEIANSGKFVHKNVTIQEWLSRRAEKAGINFSQTLQEALFGKLGITTTSNN